MIKNKKSFVSNQIILKNVLSNHNLKSYITLTKTGRNLEMEINRHYRDNTREQEQYQEPTDESLQDAIAYSTYLKPEQELDFNTNNNT